MADPGYVDLPATEHFTFEYNQSWNPSMATSIGNSLRDNAERDYANIRSWFGNLTLNLPFRVKIEPVATGTGLDAYAGNDNRQNISLNLGLKISNPSNINRAREALVAEFIEIFMVAQKPVSWVPGYSHGEALSRFGGFQLYPDVAPFWGGPDVWLDSVINGKAKTRPDWIGKTEQTDVDPISHGCGLLFLYYLNSQLGYSPSAIVNAGAATLAGVYERLSSRNDAFASFTAMVATRYPEKARSGLVGSSNPFPFTTGDGRFLLKSRISATARKTQQMDIFAVDDAGHCRTAWWNPSSGWPGWSDVLNVVFPAGAPVAAVSRAAGQLDLFAVVSDGRCYTAWWAEGQGWGGWGTVQDGVFPAGAPVAAVSRAAGHLDLFAVASDGHCYTAWWAEGHGWGGWGRVQDRVFPAGAPVAAVSRATGQLDLFAVAGDGHCYTAWWAEGRGWGGWGKVQDFVFPAGAPVAAVSRTAGHLDLFAVAGDGHCYTAWWAEGQGWGGWGKVQDFVFPAGAPVAAVSRAAGHLDLFAVAGDGHCYTAWWAEGQGWNGWGKVQDGVFPAGAPVAAVSRVAGQLDLFALAGDGRCYTAWWTEGQGWGGWGPIA
jgi:hypothetical protein